MTTEQRQSLFEITESVLSEKTDVSLAILNELRDIGVAISMDDFGTGDSSLSYLRSFRFDKVKIEKSFVSDLPTEDNSRSIVRAITDLGRSFEMAIVAEGVETIDQLRCLESEGCGQVQGFLISSPRPAHEIPAMIRSLTSLSDGNISSLPLHRGASGMRVVRRMGG